MKKRNNRMKKAKKVDAAIALGPATPESRTRSDLELAEEELRHARLHLEDAESQLRYVTVDVEQLRKRVGKAELMLSQATARALEG